MKRKLTIGFILLFSLFLLISCGDLFLPQELNKNPAQGYFSFSNDEEERTIMPKSYVFVLYTLDFFAEGEYESPVLSVDRKRANLSALIPINAGTWDLRVTAYMDDHKSYPAAKGNLNGIVISAGQTTIKSVPLMPADDTGGEGFFAWDIKFTDSSLYAGIDFFQIILTPLSGGGDKKLITIRDGTNAGYFLQKDVISLETGYYSVDITVGKKYMFDPGPGPSYGKKADLSEILHIYKNMESVFEYLFTEAHFSYGVGIVTSGEDSGPGTLREALLTAWPNSKIFVDSSVKTITLTSALPAIDTKSGTYIRDNREIDGNGVIITAMNTLDGSALGISGGYQDRVKIKRIWFKDIKAGAFSGAVIQAGGSSLYLESCIFSGNEAIEFGGGMAGTLRGNGGAIFVAITNFEMKGCTFYNNRASDTGGAIYIPGGYQYFLSGNIFYGNTDRNGSSSIYNNGVSINPTGVDGYNYLDRQPVNSSGNITISGFTVTSTPFLDPATMKVIAGTAPHNKITNLPAGYPEFDFYGERIIPGASAGAVQGKSNTDGYYLSVRSSDNTKGSVSVSGAGSGGFYKGDVNITASPTGANVLSAWKVNGVNVGNKNPLTLNITEPTDIQAVFGRLVNVTSSADSGNNTLRQAITNSQDNDVIRVNLHANDNVIELSSPLPGINKNLVMEGNGVTITSSFTFNAPVLEIANVTNVSYQVAINRIWFKDLKGARVISNYNYGPQDGNSLLTVESCIFSGSANGAISNQGRLNLNACTFYDNYGMGAAISHNGTSAPWASITMTGNLFYANTSSAPMGNNIYVFSGTVKFVSNGYNVTDNRTSNGVLPIEASDITIPTGKFLFTNDMKIIAGSEIDNVIPVLPAGYPEYDFFGNKITAPAAAGAVQERASGSGYYLGLSVNDNSKGSVSVSPQSPSGFYTSSQKITITAQPQNGYALLHWIVNGVNSGISNPLTVNLTESSDIQAVFGNLITVTSNANSGTGTLRQAFQTLTSAQDGTVIRIDLQEPDNIITLTSSLPEINNNNSITIEGNGVIITSSVTLTSSLITFYNGDTCRRTISRVWFKDIKANTTSGGAVIYNIPTSSRAQVTLESCIFSGNTNIGGTPGSYNSASGAIANQGMMNVYSCTFYGNSANNRGGAIYHTGPSTSTLTMTGNIFYDNTAGDAAPSVFNSMVAIKSNGYNIFDKYIENDNGAIPVAANDVISNRILTNHEFKILPGSKADGIITTIPVGYPSFDFYGAPITNGASAGAVQAKATGSGYYLDAKVNNALRGQVNVTPQNENSFYSSAVTITAESESGYALSHWIINGLESGNSNPLTLTLKEHTELQAVFGIAVTSNENSGPGTFRQAITDMANNDIIVFDLPADAIVTIESSLPRVDKSVTIKGNGVILKHSNMHTITSPLLVIEENIIVKINRVWLKDFLVYSALLLAPGNGSVTLESCIFSSNITSMFSNNWGAAINNAGTNLNITGCTFYGNTSNIGGAIYQSAGGTLTLTGNIFYGNSSRTNTGNTIMDYGTTNNKGCNIFDIYPVGVIGGIVDTLPVYPTDKIVNVIPFTNTTDFKPSASTKTLIPAGTWAQENMPAVDFYGTTRDWTTAGAPGAVE